MESAPPEKGTVLQQFGGFEPLTANFIYCPNQFFDVCLPHASRGAVRLVGYLLYKTLGWLDKVGNPVNQEIIVSYRDLITAAGISRGAIRAAIDEATAAGFIECTLAGQAKCDGQSGQTAMYKLKWDTAGDYVRDARQFRGFYAGEGHRTAVPNAFFDRVVRDEPLAVVKVVGTVLRHTVGYVNQFGTGRRTQAPLSYTFIQQYANIGGRANLHQAICRASLVGYIRCVEAGCVSPSSSKRRPAVYAINWLQNNASVVIGSKTEPARSERFKNGTSNGSERAPADRFKNRTKEKTLEKDTDKQQAVAVEEEKAYDLLREAGFDKRAATELSRSRGFDEIRRQIEWLPQRNPQHNPVGMLRRAIEENWIAPAEIVVKEKNEANRQRDRELEDRLAVEDRAAAEQKRRRREQRDAMLRQWATLTSAEHQRYHQAAIQQASSKFVRNRLCRHTDLDDPPRETLETMARSLSSRVGEF